MSKTYVGSRLRQLRKERGLSQANLAGTLELSASYVNQIEHDVRPLTLPVLHRITEVFGVDATFFSKDDASRLLAEVHDVMLDKELCPEDIDLQELSDLVDHHPDIARAVVEMHRRYRNVRDKLSAATDARLVNSLDETRTISGALSMPHDEVRDFFYARQNYLDDLDHTAEAISAELGITTFNIRANEAALIDRLESRHGVTIKAGRDIGSTLHHFDTQTRVLTLSTRLITGQRAFRLATELAFWRPMSVSTPTSPTPTSLPRRHAPWHGAASLLILQLPLCFPIGFFMLRRSAPATTLNIYVRCLGWDMRPYAIGFQPCSALIYEASPSLLSASIAPATSLSANQPRGSISPMQAELAHYGMSTRRSPAPAPSCGNSLKCLMAATTFGWPERCGTIRDALGKLEKCSPLAWVARHVMRRERYMHMDSM